MFCGPEAAQAPKRLKVRNIYKNTFTLSASPNTNTPCDKSTECACHAVVLVKYGSTLVHIKHPSAMTCSTQHMQNKRISDNTAPPADLNRERGSDMSWSLLTVWYLELKERRHYCINHASERKHNTDILLCPLLSTIFLTLFPWQRQWTSTQGGYVDRDPLIVCYPGFRLLSVSLTGD